MALVVLSHEHDEQAGVYRVIVGLTEGQEVAVDVEPPAASPDAHALVAAAERGEDVDADELSRAQEQIVAAAATTRATEVQQVVVDAFDFVFADNDTRWFTAQGDRLADEAVADKQARLLSAHFADQQAAAEAAQAQAPRPMPGVGREL